MLQKGAKFDDLAKKYSNGPTAAIGGDLEYFKRGTLSKELETEVFSLKAGDYTRAHRTNQGFVILKVTEHQNGGIPPLKDVENQVQEQVYMVKMQPALRDYLTKLREEAYIDIKPGYIDTGASPNETQPIYTTASTENSNPGRKEEEETGNFLALTRRSCDLLFRRWSRRCVTISAQLASWHSDAAPQVRMKDFYICDCARLENQTITSLFVVAVKQVKSKKNGELYLSLMLADRTGQLQANMWDNVDDTISSFDQDDFIKVKGILHKYNGRWQMTVHKIRKLGESEIDYSDYLPKTSKDIDQLWKTLSDYVESFQNPWLKSLLHEFMSDDALVAAYKNAPAAKTLHHAFVGGLLDHVVSLFTVCDLASRNYPQVNRDLLLTGAFLHDIGKLHELSYQRSITYTTKGQLLGHMIIELEMLHEKLTHLPGFPDELKFCSST